MKKLILVGVVGLSALLGGCVSVDSIYGPNGKPALIVECSGKMNSWNSCFKKLSEECGAAGYSLVDRNSEQHSSGGGYGTATGSGGNFTAASYSGFGTSQTRTLMAQCNQE